MNIAIITAGGVGARMHSKDKPKQFLKIDGKPILIHTVLHFEKCDYIDAIIITCVNGWIDYTEEIIRDFGINKVKSIVLGGETGQLSIFNGLCEAKRLFDTERNIVLIHDGVRPLINPEIITENIKSVEKYGSAITIGKVKETVIEINENNDVIKVPDRNFARHAKAPQGFWLDDLYETHIRAMKDGKYNFVDSCSMMFYYGKTLHTIDGLEDNIKVTTPQDYFSVRALLNFQGDDPSYE